MGLALALRSALCGAADVPAHVIDPSGAPMSGAVVALYGAAMPNFTDTLSAVMDQRNTQFDPRVLAVRVNTAVHFPNSDDVRHQVYSFSQAKRFELRLYHGTPSAPVLFDTAGEVVLGCNIHDQMLGYIYVLATPWFAVTDGAGAAVIKAVPAGTYKARLWYPGMVPGASGSEFELKVSGSGAVVNFSAASASSLSAAPSAPAATPMDQLFKKRTLNAP